MTGEILEEGDEIGQWLIDSFVAEGKTTLPDEAYRMVSGANPLKLQVPHEVEVKELFETEEDYQKFLAGEDYSYGLADVPDAKYDEHYEAIVKAIKGLVQPGIVVDLPTVPHQFLRDAPLIDGDWIDQYTIELAEWGARLIKNGFLLAEPNDNHPMDWQRIVDSEDGPQADSAVTMKLWHQTRKHLAGFSGRTKVIDQRQYLSFADYLKWNGRRSKGDLKSGMRGGMG